MIRFIEFFGCFEDDLSDTLGKGFDDITMGWECIVAGCDALGWAHRLHRYCGGSKDFRLARLTNWVLSDGMLVAVRL